MAYSIMFKNDRQIKTEAPSFFKNLNLDMVVNAICNRETDKACIPYYYTKLESEEEIIYRQDVFKDLEKPEIMQMMLVASSRFQTIYQANKTNSTMVSVSWDGKKNLIKFMNLYLEAIENFKNSLNTLELKSEALLGLKDYLNSYVEKANFKRLIDDLKYIKELLTTIRYTLMFKNTEIFVDKGYDAENYTPKYLEYFSKFDWESNKKFDKDVSNIIPKQIDERVLGALSRLYKDEFDKIKKFTEAYNEFFDESFNTLATEIRFYISYMAFRKKLTDSGLSFCYPIISKDNTEESIDSYDLALAYKLMLVKERVVTNSYELKNSERVIILSGPNQGGKTTFARQMGQLHYLTLLGVPVQGYSLKLHLVDNIYTYFKTDEDLENLNGKLQSELIGVKEIFDNMTENSLILLNEIFASTTALDGTELSKKLIDRIKDTNALCLFVTFLEDLSNYSEITTSMVSNVLPDNPMIRTYKITKSPSNGKAYAEAISSKYNLTFDEIKRRLDK